MKKIFGIILLLSSVHSNNLNCMTMKTVKVTDKVTEASKAYLEASNALNNILDYRAESKTKADVQKALVNLLNEFVTAHGTFIKNAPACMQNNFFNNAIFLFIQNKIDQTLGQCSRFQVIDWFAQMEMQINSVSNKLISDCPFIEG